MGHQVRERHEDAGSACDGQKRFFFEAVQGEIEKPEVEGPSAKVEVKTVQRENDGEECEKWEIRATERRNG